MHPVPPTHTRNRINDVRGVSRAGFPAQLGGGLRSISRDFTAHLDSEARTWPGSKTQKPKRIEWGGGGGICARNQMHKPPCRYDLYQKLSLIHI
eukprot:2720313-Rhodomonas_salina.2